jgi:hypothetical protein
MKRKEQFITSDELIKETAAAIAQGIQSEKETLSDTKVLAEAYLLAISSTEIMADEKSRRYVEELKNLIEQSVLDSWGDRVGIDIDQKNLMIQVFHEDGRRVRFTLD